MDQFVIEIKPYIDDDTTVYLTNSEAIAKEATKDVWLPIIPLKETLKDGTVRTLWLYETVEEDYIDVYMDAFDELKKMGLYTKYGVHTYNIDFVLDDDRDYYIERRAWLETPHVLK
jgi:hypothetical protein